MSTPIAKAFSSAAQKYEMNAHIQRKVAASLVSDLISTRVEPESILELGAGSGFLTSLLRSQFPISNILATDISEDLLAILSKKSLPSVSTQLLSAENAHEHIHHHDLTTSSMMLQWVQNPDHKIAHWLESMTSGSALALSYLVDSSFPEWKQAKESSQVFSQGTPLPKSQDMMQVLNTANNVEVLSDTHNEFQYCAADPLLLLKNMKAVGANYTENPSVSVSQMRKLLSHWPEENQLFTLTYSVHNVIVRKK